MVRWIYLMKVLIYLTAEEEEDKIIAQVMLRWMMKVNLFVS